MADKIEEFEFEVSADLVRECPGLSLDVGGSVAKIVYRRKEDWDAVTQNKEAKNGKLRLLLCARTKLFEALDIVKHKGYITRQEDGKPTEIFTCGIGCSQFGTKINKELNVKLANVMEFECFTKAFVYLTKRYNFATLIKPKCQDVLDKVASMYETEQMKERLKKFRETTSMKIGDIDSLEPTSQNTIGPYESLEPVAKALGDKMFPCIIAMLGSGFGFMKINADGTSQIASGSNRGGRTFLGLGSLLLKAKSYDEIIDLAEKGNEYELHTSQRAFNKEMLPPPEGEEKGTDTYSFFIDDDVPEQLVFAFGNAVNKETDDFKREDIAAALLTLSINDTVQTLYSSARKNEIKTVFVCGSYANRDFVREKFTMQWAMIDLGGRAMGLYTGIDLYFMKQGSHLGALGALINNIEKFIGADGKVAAKTPPKK